MYKECYMMDNIELEVTEVTEAVEEVVEETNKIDIEPLFEEMVDFDTFSKSDFRVVKVKECFAVPKSKKLLQFTLDDGTGTDRTILSGIHAFYLKYAQVFVLLQISFLLLHSSLTHFLCCTANSANSFFNSIVIYCNAK